MSVTRIISGGQTGADRGGLDAAMALGLPHGGWCPKCRRAEDGAIPERYCLTELSSTEYPKRTKRNIREADGTVVFSFGRPDGGSSLTLAIAKRLRKPHLQLDLNVFSVEQAARELSFWCGCERVETLNVAGSRESTAPGIQSRVCAVVTRAIDPEN